MMSTKNKCCGCKDAPPMGTSSTSIFKYEKGSYDSMEMLNQMHIQGANISHKLSEIRANILWSCLFGDLNLGKSLRAVFVSLFGQSLIVLLTLKTNSSDVFSVAEG